MGDGFRRHTPVLAATVASDFPERNALFLTKLRLRQLKAIGLDWDWPEFAPAGPAAGEPLQVQVDLGEGVKKKQE